MGRTFLFLAKVGYSIHPNKEKKTVHQANARQPVPLVFSCQCGRHLKLNLIHFACKGIYKFVDNFGKMKLLIWTWRISQFSWLKYFTKMNSRRDTIFHVLDLPLDSSPRIVRKKCQDLLLKYHPDKNLGQESEEYHKVGKFWLQSSSSTL